MNVRPLILAVVAALGSAWAQDTTAPDPDLPQPFDPATLAESLTSAPFNRVVSFADTYLLTGAAYLDGKPVATLMNKETKQRFTVTNEPNAQGWKLEDANLSLDPKHTQVRILVGQEEVHLTYTTVETKSGKPAPGSIAERSGRRREVTPVDIHNLPESEYLRKDKDGKPYIRGSVYLPTEDRDRYYNELSREGHDKFLSAIQDHREKMFNYTPDQRAAYAKKVFDKVWAEDQKGKR